MNSFEKWFSKATEKFERTLIRLGIVLLILLFASQFLLTNDNLRALLNGTERLEGEQVETVMQPKSPTKDSDLYIELLLEGEELQPQVKVLVNDKPSAIFDQKKVLINVTPGDRVEIDGQLIADSVTVKIASAHTSIKTPRVGHTVTTYSTNELLGWITKN